MFIFHELLFLFGLKDLTRVPDFMLSYFVLSKCNSTPTGSPYKKARVQTSAQSTFKVYIYMNMIYFLFKANSLFYGFTLSLSITKHEHYLH